MLGDTVERTLKRIGVDSQLVERWLGKPCRCPERVEKLNQLEMWARQFIRGRINEGKNYLVSLMEQKDD